MTDLLKWAWPFLLACALFDAFSFQMFYVGAPSGIVNNVLFSIGMFAGDLPAAVVAGVLVGACYFAYTKGISLRAVAVALGIGCLVTAVVIKPVLLARWGVYPAAIEYPHPD